MDKTNDPGVTAITHRANFVEHRPFSNTCALDLQARRIGVRFGMALPTAKLLAEIVYTTREANVGYGGPA